MFGVWNWKTATSFADIKDVSVCKTSAVVATETTSDFMLISLSKRFFFIVRIVLVPGERLSYNCAKGMVVSSSKR